MATDTKKHSTIAAGESPTRAALAAAILSINDVVPVANATEATQVAVALAGGGQALATTPVIVSRADGRGLHRVEITYDVNGLVWLPLSGSLAFTNDTVRDNWTSANSSYLSVGDVCFSGSVECVWNGATWNPQSGVTVTLASGWTATAGTFICRRRLDEIEVSSVELARTGSGLAVNPGAAVTVGVLPVGYRPAAVAPIGVGSIGVAGQLGASRWYVDAGGNIFFQSLVSGGTMAVGGGVQNHVLHGGGKFKAA